MAISFQFDNVRIGSGSLFLIAGPCVIESEDHAIRMAEIIKGVTRSLNFPFIFKASYDKANRTSLKSFRGPGLKEGLRILKKVKNEVKVPILTDVHEAGDVSTVAEVADILQIPAFLCRQTDLLVAAAAVALSAFPGPKTELGTKWIRAPLLGVAPAQQRGGRGVSASDTPGTSAHHQVA